MRTLTFVMLGLILALFGPVEAAQDAWKPITAGGMSVSLPCTGDWQSTRQDVPEEASVVIANLLTCRTTDSFYLITWTEVETNAQFDGMAALRSSRDAFLREAGDGQLITSADIVHDGLKGIEFTAHLRGLLLSSRGVFHKKRWYQVAIGTPLNQDRSKDIKRLLTSLKIKR